MTCCNNDCRQGRDYPARERFINLGLSLAGYAAVIGAGLCAAISVAIWFSLPG